MADSENAQAKGRVDLTGDWQFRIVKPASEIPPHLSEDLEGWMEATVPGTVHTDLMALNKIPDPFHRDNENRVQWVASLDWEYQRIFRVDADVLDAQNIDLVCEGLDTYAEIILNGRIVDSCENMFIPHRFDVRAYLQEGENEVLVRFQSPLRRSRQLEKQYGKLPAARHSHRVYIRKAQYAFGWDWGPCLPTSGIWRPIYLEHYGMCRIADVWVKVVDLTKEMAAIEVEVEVHKTASETIRYGIEITGDEDLPTQEVATDQDRFCTTITIADPNLWWPNGFGDQPLYRVNVRAYHGDACIDDAVQYFGIRKVELELKDENDNHCFRIRVNDVPIYCKGVDWIPADSFLPRVTAREYGLLLNRARDAHMNMIRVWGGGIYEDPVFYQKCDELGLMVWQDFMFACAGYPEEAWFQDAVRGEADSIIRLLRNHPSIVIWCGNNENEWIWFRETGKPVDEMPGYSIFHQVLPDMVHQLDPQRPYWPTSPWSEGDPNDPHSGNHHAWQVWSYWDDYTKVSENEGRFITEFGWQAPACIETMEGVLGTDERDPQNRIFEFHNKQDEGMERLFRFLAGHQKITTDFLPFIYSCQVNQGEALKFCIEHWRRRKFTTAGSLIWQLNDCWPVISWSLIDSHHRLKASYYYAKRFFAPLILCFQESDKGTEVYLVNDLLDDVQGVLDLQILDFHGESLGSRDNDVYTHANSVMKVLTLNHHDFSGIPPDSGYVRCTFQGEGHRIDACTFMDRYKFIQFPGGRVEACLKSEGDLGLEFEISASVLMKSIYLHLNGWEFSDNFFDLHPHETVTITGRKMDPSAGDIRNLETLSVGHYSLQKLHWKDMPPFGNTILERGKDESR